MATADPTDRLLEDLTRAIETASPNPQSQQRASSAEASFDFDPSTTPAKGVQQQGQGGTQAQGHQLQARDQRAIEPVAAPSKREERPAEVLELPESPSGWDVGSEIRARAGPQSGFKRKLAQVEGHVSRLIRTVEAHPSEPFPQLPP